MSQHQENTTYLKNFTTTALFSFGIILSLLFLLSKCHGDYKAGYEENHSIQQAPSTHH